MKNNKKDSFEEYINEFGVKANEVIKMKMIKREEDFENEDNFFNVEYTHQIFGEDEIIVGYKNPSMKIYYVASTLSTCIEFVYSSRITMGKDLDPFYLLTKKKINFQDGSQHIPFGYEFTEKKSDLKKALNTKFDPNSFSKQISSYEQDKKTFEVYYSDFENEKLLDYHTRLQTFSLFFINNSSYLDKNDKKWKIFLIFEKYKEKEEIKYSIIGYSTVYPFYGYPNSIRLRISQFLILPPFRKQGHGSKLLNSIYDYGKQVNCLEICVEDPSDEFQLIRDKLDFKRFNTIVKNDLIWNEDFWKDIREQSKMNQNQIRKCYEIYKLNQILSYKDESIHQKKKELLIEMKTRLYKEFDLIHCFEEKDLVKEKLEELYQEEYSYYLSILGTKK